MARNRTRAQRNASRAGASGPGIKEMNETRRILLQVGEADPGKEYVQNWTIDPTRLGLQMSALEYRLVSASGKWYGVSGSNSQGVKTAVLMRHTHGTWKEYSLAKLVSLSGKAVTVGSTLTLDRATGDGIFVPLAKEVGSLTVAASIPGGGGKVSLGFIELDVTVRLRGIHATSITTPVSKVSSPLTWGYLNLDSVHLSLANQRTRNVRLKDWSKGVIEVDQHHYRMVDGRVDFDLEKIAATLTKYRDIYNSTVAGPAGKVGWDLYTRRTLDQLVYTFFQAFYSGGFFAEAGKGDGYTLFDASMDNLLTAPVAVWKVPAFKELEPDVWPRLVSDDTPVSKTLEQGKRYIPPGWSTIYPGRRSP